MTENDLIVYNPQFIAPVVDVGRALQAYQAMKDFVSGVLRENVDYGIIPGTDKPTLLKPGAEKLNRFFGLSIQLEQLSAVEDWTGDDHKGEPFFFYRYKAKAMRSGQIIAEGIGSCSSWEKKYRYRQAQRLCPTCGQPSIFKSKNKPEFYCWAKKGGCGATFQLTDKRITEQEVGQVKNPDAADVANTIDKMSQKRSVICVTLLACNASEYFNQDLEDYIIPGEYVEEVRQPEPAKPTPPAPANNGHKAEAEQAPARMTIEMAESEISNSTHSPYGTLSDVILSNHSIGLGKMAKQTDETRRKMEAIRVILAARAAGRPVQEAVTLEVPADDGGLPFES